MCQRAATLLRMLRLAIGISTGKAMSEPIMLSTASLNRSKSAASGSKEKNYIIQYFRCLEVKYHPSVTSSHFFSDTILLLLKDYAAHFRARLRRTMLGWSNRERGLIRA